MPTKPELPVYPGVWLVEKVSSPVGPSHPLFSSPIFRVGGFVAIPKTEASSR
jgi:hypothetical protein